MAYLWVGFGGALGSMARYGCGLWAEKTWGTTFPWGTLLINVVGSLVIGLLAGLGLPEARWSLSPEARLFLMTGFCGGFTTFSTFSLQTLGLIQQGQWAKAGWNCGLSVSLCVLGAAAGLVLAQSLNRSAA